MHIHEYQAKEIFRNYGVPTPKGKIAFSADEAAAAAEELPGPVWVVKAQIHAGGRGKGGGVKIAKTIDEVRILANEMIGMKLVTHQTGPEGKSVRKVYIEEGADIRDEFYLGMVLDRARELPVMMASTEGGVEIEKVAAETPEKIVKVAVDPSIGFMAYHGRILAYGLGLPKEQTGTFVKFASSLYKVYTEKDAELIEINPLIRTGSGDFLALDAKMGFDDNAVELGRQPDIAAMRDPDEEEPVETEAKESNLSYVKLDGNVGCMVNGAGLAMGTMDAIHDVGGSPANFLDVGGGASAQTVAKGFEIILRDPNVSAIFVNIFGGIVRCDRVANGILEATKMTEVRVPVIVRLDGTNAEEAADIIQNAGIENIISAADLEEGAKKAVAAAGGV